MKNNIRNIAIVAHVDHGKTISIRVFAYNIDLF